MISKNFKNLIRFRKSKIVYNSKNDAIVEFAILKINFGQRGLISIQVSEKMKQHNFIVACSFAIIYRVFLISHNDVLQFQSYSQ